MIAITKSPTPTSLLAASGSNEVRAGQVLAESARGRPSANALTAACLRIRGVALALESVLLWNDLIRLVARLSRYCPRRKAATTPTWPL
jgi:hypothetical protein